MLSYDVASSTPNNFTLSNGYWSSNTTILNCAHTEIIPTNAPLTSVVITYTFSGRYVSYDYLYKTFTLPTNHYRVIIRFGIGHIGVWSAADYLQLSINDSLQSYFYTYAYNCNTALLENLCTTRVGNHIDCIGTYEQQIQHNTSMLVLNFTSLTNIKDPNIQYWGLFDLLIVTLNCDVSCATCYGNLNTQCFTCNSGFYLSINTCSVTCPNYILPSNVTGTGSCVTACPNGYYAWPNATAPNILCNACPFNCTSCINSTNCLYMTTDLAPQYSTWIQYLEIWVLLIILGAILLFALIYRIFFYQAANVNVTSENVMLEHNDTKVNVPERHFEDKETEKSDKGVHHIEDIDFIDHVKVDNVRKRKRQPEKKDFNKT